MRFSRLALVACFVPLLASCGSSPSVPSEMPDLRGGWNGAAVAWRWSNQYAYDSTLSSSGGCEGTLDITQQNGTSFSGRYAINCPREGRSAGAVVGEVSPSGRVRFELRPEEGWEPGTPPGWFNTPCVLSADTVGYEGTVANGSLSANRTQTHDCLPGRVFVHARFQGLRQ